MQSSVTRSKLKRLDKLLVFHEIEAVHDVNAALLGEDECVVHELDQRSNSGNVVVRIGSTDLSVNSMTEDRGRKKIERAEVGNLFGGRILNDESLNNTLDGTNPVANISLIEVNGKGEILEIGAQQGGDFRNILFAHLTDTSSLGSLLEENRNC